MPRGFRSAHGLTTRATRNSIQCAAVTIDRNQRSRSPEYAVAPGCAEISGLSDEQNPSCRQGPPHWRAFALCVSRVLIERAAPDAERLADFGRAVPTGGQCLIGRDLFRRQARPISLGAAVRVGEHLFTTGRRQGVSLTAYRLRNACDLMSFLYNECIDIYVCKYTKWQT